MTDTRSERPVCPRCKAPIKPRLAITDRVVWRFDAEAVIRERIDAMTTAQVVELCQFGLNVLGVGSLNGARDFRALLREALRTP